jgi:hypothetical protein
VAIDRNEQVIVIVRRHRVGADPRVGERGRDRRQEADGVER